MRSPSTCALFMKLNLSAQLNITPKHIVEVGHMIRLHRLLPIYHRQSPSS